jgi:hypothetical protein
MGRVSRKISHLFIVAARAGLNFRDDFEVPRSRGAIRTLAATVPRGARPGAETGGKQGVRRPSREFSTGKSTEFRGWGIESPGFSDSFAPSHRP